MTTAYIEVVNNVNPVFTNTVENDIVFYGADSTQSMHFGISGPNKSVVKMTKSNVSIAGDLSVESRLNLNGLRIGKRTELTNPYNVVANPPLSSNMSSLSNELLFTMILAQTRFKFTSKDGTDLATLCNNGQILMNSNLDSASFPSYSWMQNPNTGMYNVDNNIIGFASGGQTVATMSNTTATFSNVMASNLSGNGAALTNLNADNITTGIVNSSNLPTATTTSVGITQLTDSTSNASSTLAASAKAVKLTMDSVISFVGVILPYGGTSPPVGWLLCFGQSVSRTTYSALFLVLGTTYGSVDSNTFTIPDFRGRVPVGLDSMGGTAANRITSAICGINGTSLGASGGDQKLHAHTHSITDPGHAHGVGYATVGFNVGGTYEKFIREQGAPNNMISNTNTTGITINNNTQGGSAQNVQPSIMINYIIKY